MIKRFARYVRAVIKCWLDGHDYARYEYGTLGDEPQGHFGKDVNALDVCKRCGHMHGPYRGVQMSSGAVMWFR